MIKIFDKDFDINKILSREIQSYGEYEESVRQIVADVMTGGDAAVKKYTRKFDGVSVDGLAVSGAEIDEAFASVSPRFLEVVKKSAENIAEFHSKQKKSGFEINRDGVTLGQKYTAVEKAGLYVPGGTASYPSTVLMNAVPAKIAGVGEIIMCTPPSANGKVRAEILAAAKIAGVDRIYKCGGAQAIAAMAYGTESIPKVYKIVGPGNIFVALAKKLVFGTVSIDMIAGPSEILVVADGKADARHVAADMLSQAEHDKLASAVLVTDSAVLAKDVAAEIDRQLETLPRREIASASIENNGKIIVTDSIERAVEVANAIAPEHLEMCVENPRAWLDKIKNAGSVFLGGYTPEALGDYYAGPNHTLPTGGSAKFSSPLSVDDFLKKTQYIMYSAEALEKAAAITGLSAQELSDQGDTAGNLPCYNFGNEEVSISITKQGGYLHYLMNSRIPEGSAISPEDAVAIGSQWLEQQGYDSMQESYYEINSNRITINYAYAQNGSILCYPDLIKLTVALDNGEVLEVEASGYLVSHQQRLELTPALTAEQAAQSLSQLLTVENSRLTVIPTSGQNEVFCWEFSCASQKEEQVLVYVNAQTGAEEQILVVYTDENGTLTM